MLCTFWLRNVLRATPACTFSTSQLPKVVRDPGVLYILTSKCASRHNGVQFFISHLARWLRTRRFSEPTFRPSGATNHWKNTVNRDFPTFSRICIFFLITLSLLLFFLQIFLFSLPLPCSAFHLSILSEVWLLNFLRSSYPCGFHGGWDSWNHHTLACRHSTPMWSPMGWEFWYHPTLREPVKEILHMIFYRDLVMFFATLFGVSSRDFWKSLIRRPTQIYGRLRQFAIFLFKWWENGGKGTL